LRCIAAVDSRVPWQPVDGDSAITLHEATVAGEGGDRTLEKPIMELTPGDVIVAFVHADGRVHSVRGGPLEIAAIELTGGQWDGVPQVRISATHRNRAPRFAIGATHAVVRAR